MKVLAILGILLNSCLTSHAFNWPVSVKIVDENQKGISVSVVITEPAEQQFGVKSVSNVSIDQAAALLSKLGAGGRLDTFSIGIIANPESDGRRYRPILQAIINNLGTRIVFFDDGRSASMYQEMIEKHSAAQK